MAKQGKGYEFFDHTADIGIRAQGETLSELFMHAAQALTELLVEESHIESRLVRAIHLDADNAESLLLSWLSELLFWFSTKRFLAATYAFDDISCRSLRGTIRGEAFDVSRHTQGREVKAITRHMLEVRQEKGIWQAQVIVDI
jgi:SHS2 domain-containing protein